MKKLVAVTLTCIMALAQLPLLAQAGQPQTGAVTGKATSNTGRRLSGMTIQLRNASGMIIGSTVTDRDGVFTMAALAAGTYTVECLSEKRQVLGSTKANLTPPTVDVSLTCTSDVVAWPIFSGKALAALGAAAVALSAVAVVSTRDDGSPSR